MFGSTATARVAPAAPPTLSEEEVSEEERREPPQRELDAGRAREADAPEGMPLEVFDLLRSMGIEIPRHSQVHVATHTTELSGFDALKFLGQMGGFFGQTEGSRLVMGTPLQMHPEIRIVADGVAQASPEHLRAVGVDAQVRIVDFEAKPMAFGDSHVAKLRLEVTRPGSEPYEVVTGALVPTRVTEEFAEGKTFPAKVNPDDGQQVLVEWGAP